MIHEIHEKHDNFYNATSYALERDRGYRIDSSAGPDADISAVVRDFQSYRVLNPRVKRPVFHSSISLAPGESLSDPQWREVAHRYLQTLGFEDCAFLVAKHTNTSCEHIHIVASRITASGKCVSDSRDYARGEQLMRVLESELGLRSVAPSLEATRRDLSGREIHAAISKEEPNLRFELQTAIQAAAQGSDFREFHRRLENQGIGLHLHLGPDGRPRGISYELDGAHFDGSSLGRAYTWKGLQKHSGLTLAPSDESLIRQLVVGDRTLLSPEPQTGLLRLRAIVDGTLRGEPAFGRWIEDLKKHGVQVALHMDSAGQPRGISYSYEGQTWTGTQLGKTYSWGGILRRGLRLDTQKEESLLRQLAIGPVQKLSNLSTWKDSEALSGSSSLAEPLAATPSTSLFDVSPEHKALPSTGPPLPPTRADVSTWKHRRAGDDPPSQNPPPPPSTSPGLRGAPSRPAPPADDANAWSGRALQELQACLSRISAKHSRRDLSSALFELRKAPAAAIRAAAHAQFLFAAMTNPRVAARLVTAHLPAGRSINTLLAFFGAIRSPGAAAIFALRMATRTLHSAAQAKASEVLARKLVHGYATAAMVDSPGAVLFAKRLSEAGITVESQDREIVFHLADQTIRASQLGADLAPARLRSTLGADCAERLAPRSRLALFSDPEPVLHLGTLGGGASASRSPERRVLLSGSSPARPLARDPSSTPPTSPADSSSVPEMGSLARDPSRPTPHPPDPDFLSSRLVSAVREPAHLSDRPRVREAPLESPSGGSSPAAIAPGRDFEAAVDRHLNALASERFDLRIVRASHPPTTLRNVRLDQLPGLRSQLAALEREGATFWVRAKTADLQLLRNVPIETVASAFRKGFEAAAVVESRKGLCDVWIRHRTGTSNTPPEVTLYMRRAVCLEYGGDLTDPAGFGALATRSEALKSAHGGMYSRSQNLEHFFDLHRARHRQELSAACQAAGVLSLTEYRAAHPSLSPRQVDAQWCRLVLEAGLRPEHVFTSLAVEGSRRQVPGGPERSVRYAARALQEGLAFAHGIRGEALRTATLQAVSNALSLSLKVLRITGMVIDLVSGLGQGRSR